MKTHHPAPATDRPMHSPIPKRAHTYGDDSSRKRPTLNDSPWPGGECMVGVGCLPVNKRYSPTTVATDEPDTSSAGRV